MIIQLDENRERKKGQELNFKACLFRTRRMKGTKQSVKNRSNFKRIKFKGQFFSKRKFAILVYCCRAVVKNKTKNVTVDAVANDLQENRGLGKHRLYRVWKQSNDVAVGE